MNEFVSYRILYFLIIRSTSEMHALLSSLTKEQKKNELIIHSLQIRHSYIRNDYISFFKLYKTAEFHVQCLLKDLHRSVQINSLLTICHCYRPLIGIDYIFKILGYESLEKCIEDLRKLECIFDDEKKPENLKTKESLTNLLKSTDSNSNSLL